MRELFLHKDASGKSNILKAINFCCRMVLESHLNNEGTVFNFMPFKFDGYDAKPSEFLIDFVCSGVEYEYSFALTRTEVLRESLYYYPNGKRAKVFTRDENAEEVYSFSPGIIVKPKDVAINTGKKNLFLSRASSMNCELPQELYRYFLNTFLLGLVDLNSVSVEENFNAYKKVILKALSICDTDICDIKVRHDDSSGMDVPPVSL
ncbi:MAG: AAA family ATPase [Clostridiales bacterium]|nr:AAA family ATPase [Clostridiales bacterium]MDY4111821.1 AAA family ATPase [Roseburia sp.]